MEDIFVPAVGMAMDAATLVEWVKQPGDAVQPGDEIALIETDKATMGLSATSSGRLGMHRFAEGDTVAPGATVTVVLLDGEDESAPRRADADEVRDSVSPAPLTESVATQPQEVAAPLGPADVARKPHRLSPRQRRLAAKAITDEPSDVGDVAAVRDAIGRQVSRSWTEIPHFAVYRDIDADGVTDRLATEPVAVSVTDLLIRSLGRAVSAYGPSAIGLAVATRYGVLLPVLPGAADHSLAEIAELRRAAVERARNRRSTEDDAQTPLVTLSNLGTHGVDWFTGIIPLGQRGLLTTGTLQQRAVVKDGRLAAGWRLSAVLNVDHRAWDGADAANLLAEIARQIADYGRYADGA